MLLHASVLFYIYSIYTVCIQYIYFFSNKSYERKEYAIFHGVRAYVFPIVRLTVLKQVIGLMKLVVKLRLYYQLNVTLRKTFFGGLIPSGFLNISRKMKMWRQRSVMPDSRGTSMLLGQNSKLIFFVVNVVHYT